MFTGLVECVGEVLSVSRRGSGVHVLRISAPEIAPEIKRGESVAVAGACLTAVSASREFFEAEMMAETIRSTRLGSLKPGDRVNLERAMRMGARLDGHLVAGHVDEVGRVARVEAAGGTRECWVSVSSAVAGFIAGKGSVALDGVSLTVIDVTGGAGETEEGFSVGLIPTTLRETTIGYLRAGDPVNVEVDMIARYTARLMRHGISEAPAEQPRGGVTWERLQEHGWV